MNAQDAISAADLEPGDYEPMEACLDCGVAIPAGLDTCAACDAQRDEFVTNNTATDDPRR